MKQSAIAGNTSTGVIKLIALVCMCLDHAGKMLFPHVPEMRMLGRIAFPLYAWCLVVGFEHTRSVPKYMLRLLLIGLVSQPLYMLALNHTWDEPNIFLTLLISLGALWGLRERKWFSHIWAPAAALVLAILLHADYGWKGVLLVLLLYAARHKRSSLAAVMIAFCLYWGTSSSSVNTIFGLRLTPLTASPVGALLIPVLRLQAMALLALPFMLVPMPRFRLPSWVGYALYPGHLALLWALQQPISPTTWLGAVCIGLMCAFAVWRLTRKA